MTTQKRPTYAVLANGKFVGIRHRVVRGGWVLGYVTWNGTFINIANVIDVS